MFSAQLLWDGVKAMILGMGMVYIFLIIMIWIMNLTSKLLKPFADRFEPKAPVKKAKPVASGLSDAKLADAAIAAVKQFRSSGSTEPATIGVNIGGKNLAVQVRAAGSAAPAPAVPKTAPAASGAGKEITSPLPGTIVRIEVREGDTVAENDLLAVIEAMKMETEIRAEEAGTITQVLIAAKDVVAAEQPIFTIEVKK